MNNRGAEHINLERILVVSLLFIFKSIRYVFRITYKLVRLFFRVVVLLYHKTELFITPYWNELREKIYLRACKVFDLKTER